MMIDITTPECTICDESSVVTVYKQDLMNWWEGTYIQDAFPYLSDDIRELLITGTHPHCWDIIVGDIDE